MSSYFLQQLTYKKLCLYREQIQSSSYYNEDPGTTSGHGQYDRLRARPPHLAIDQYSDSSFRSDQEPPPGNYGRDYFSSEDLKGPEGHRAPPLAGRYGGSSSQKRSIGQAYACQSSPTQPHPPEKKQFPKQSEQDNDQDENARQGMRSWRIHSYLSSYEDSGEEGLAQPMGSDAFEDPPTSQPSATESSAPHFGVKEPPTVPSKPKLDIYRPRYGKPMTESNSKDSAPTATTGLLSSVSDLKPLVPIKKETELVKETEKETERGTVREVGVDVEAKETSDLFLSKHDSFRSRLNPGLQRSSRLRSSLIFSSSKAEIHSGSLGLKPATEEDAPLDSLRTSSIVAQILEKRRSMSREPFDWRKKLEERNKEKLREKDEKEEKEQQDKKETERKDEIKGKEESQETNKEVKMTTPKEKSEDTTQSSQSMNDPVNQQQYFKDLAATKRGSKIDLSAKESAEKKPGHSDKLPLNPTLTPNVPTNNSAESEPKRPDISAKLAELGHRSSVFSSKPPISSTKPSASSVKPSEITQPSKEESSSEGLKKDIFKSLRPIPSPKIFRKDPLKFRLNPRRSCGEEILTTDATDAEKSELKKSRSQSTSTMHRDDLKEGLQKVMGSTTSINTLGEGKSEGKTKDFFKKGSQMLKGILGPKDKDKKSSGDDRSMSIVIEHSGDSIKKQSLLTKDTGSTTTDQTTTNNKTSTGISGPSRYQAPGSSVLSGSNLRDDTKVLIGQISANSQKNRLEREETTGDRDSNSLEKALERQNSIKRLLRPQGNNLEREGLLKRIESMRKEKKVYSRFEVVYHCKDVHNMNRKEI